MQKQIQNTVKFINYLQLQHFSRRQGEKLSFKDKSQKSKQSKFQQMIKNQQENIKEQKEIEKLYEEKYSPEQIMAKQHMPSIELPEILLKRARQVFSKYHTKDIRKMGQEFIRMYQQLHATEKTQDILALKPFANTKDLQQLDNIDPDKIYLRSPNLTLQEAQEQAEQKRKQRVQTRKQKYQEQEKEQEQKQQTNEDKVKQQTEGNTSKQLLNYTQNMAIAYLLRKMPHSYAVQKRIVNEIKKRMPLFEPKSLLDYGAGVGHSGHLFLQYYPDLQNTVFLEPSTTMRKLGKHFTQDLQNPLWVDNLQRLSTIPSSSKSYDIVLCSLVLEEVPSPIARQIIIEQLWKKVSENGILIVIEPGSPMGSRFIHDIRQYILQKKDDDPNIIAPCPHKKQCPLAQNPKSWCHFSQQVQLYPKDVFPKLTKERNQLNEKFSYIVFHKGKFNFDPLNQNALPYEQSFDWNRIIFPQIKNGGHIHVDLCTNEGEFERRTVAKSHEEYGKNGYKELKRLKWGDLWRFQNRIPNKYRKESLHSKRLW